MFWDLLTAVLALFTGIGIFVVGISMLSASLRKNSTQKMHAMFQKIGNNRFSGVALGSGVTAVIQSSTAVTVMTVGLVHAGILSLFQATAIIMGANIGTSLSNLIVGLSFLPVRNIIMSLTFFGLLVKTIGKKERYKIIGNVLISVGIVFVGMNLMSGAFRGSNPVSDFFTTLFEHVTFPIFLVLLGALFTAIVQSSTASMAIYMSMVSEGIMSFQTGMFLILGTEMGTCVTAMIASIDGNRAAKRAALTHLLYNVFGTMLFLAIVWPLQGVIVPIYERLIPDVVWQMALFPLVNNIISVAILIWFIKPFNRLVYWLVKDKPNPEDAIIDSFTDRRLLATPPFAIAQAVKGVNYIGAMARNNIEQAFNAVITADSSQKEKIEKAEASINSITNSISDYLVKISTLFISSANQNITAGLHHVLSDVERIGDQAITLLNSAAKKQESGVKFSDEANKELTRMFDKVNELFTIGLENDFINEHHKVKQKNATLRQEIDKIKTEITDSHIKRLQAGVCASGAAEYYYAVITSLKSVAEHLLNIDKILGRLSKKTTKKVTITNYTSNNNATQSTSLNVT